MYMDGRIEKRLWSEIPVRLLTGDLRSILERTVTVNVSAHGARVRTRRAWQENEQIGVASLSSGFNMRARVIYCELQRAGEFCLGLEFRPGNVDWQLFARG
jgi:PilZ domain